MADYKNHCFEFEGEEIEIYIEKTFQGTWVLTTWDSNDDFKTHQYIDYTLEEAIESFKEKVYGI